MSSSDTEKSLPIIEIDFNQVLMGKTDNNKIEENSSDSNIFDSDYGLEVELIERNLFIEFQIINQFFRYWNKLQINEELEYDERPKLRLHLSPYSLPQLNVKLSKKVWLYIFKADIPSISRRFSFDVPLQINPTGMLEWSMELGRE